MGRLAFICAVVLLAVLGLHFWTQDVRITDPVVADAIAKNIKLNRGIVTQVKGSIEVTDDLIPTPPFGKLLVRVKYAPINPSDVYRALGAYKVGDEPEVYPHANGYEGMGEVVGSGGGILATLYAVLRSRVAFAVPAGGAWQRYVIVNPMEVLPLGGSLADIQGAAAFVNPMTVLGFLESAKEGGHHAIVHTAANSALGKMLLRAAPAYNVTIIAVVRGEKNERNLIDDLGHPSSLVVRSDLPDFQNTLRQVAQSHGATLAFDAVAGSLADQVYDAMPAHSSVFVYGQLSGQAPPQSLFDRSTPEKPFAIFHVKAWLDAGGLLRKLSVGLRCGAMLENELATEFSSIVSIDDDKIIDTIKSYYNHQAGGKIAISLK